MEKCSLQIYFKNTEERDAMHAQASLLGYTRTSDFIRNALKGKIPAIHLENSWRSVKRATAEEKMKGIQYSDI